MCIKKMKYVVKHVNKDFYFEADSIEMVYRHLLKDGDEIIDYITFLFHKEKFGHFEDLTLCNDDEIGDCDEDKFEAKYRQYTKQLWFQYINIEIPRLYKLWQKFQDELWTKEKFVEKMLQALDDQSLQNIFTYFNTSGGGHQWGNPSHESWTVSIEEYKQPKFVKI